MTTNHAPEHHTQPSLGGGHASGGSTEVTHGRRHTRRPDTRGDHHHLDNHRHSPLSFENPPKKTGVSKSTPIHDSHIAQRHSDDSTHIPFGKNAATKAPLFTLDTLKRDAPAGIITGLMGIPLTVGICLMSDYPVQMGLATAVIACVVSFISYLFRPGNHVGVPGVAAGLAPVLAMGIHKFGLQNMPWLIFLTSMMQMIVWSKHWEGYILKAVPSFLIEGLLAGVGLKIAMKFLPETYAVIHESDIFWSNERLVVTVCSVGALGLFMYLYRKFKDTSPGIPYIAVIGGSVWLASYLSVPMLHVEPVAFKLALPFPDFNAITPAVHVDMFLYAAMLMLIDVIEQVMSNAAIEKIDPMGRKANSNNSLMSMWIGNLASSFIGGMTNLDGLAKSSTNRMAGAVTKMSALFVGAVFGVALAFPVLLTHLPEFSLAILMIFTGWKMIAGLYHVAQHGKYELVLSIFCGVLVFRLGIFEGLMICLAIHSFINLVIYRHSKVPIIAILKKVLLLFTDQVHPHSTSTLDVGNDDVSGGLRYKSIIRSAGTRKTLDEFFKDWADGVNRRNLLSVTSTYDVKGLLWGTFAKDLRAGHANIKRYFEHLFDLDNLAVDFESSETRQYNDIYIRSGSYRFSYLKKGVRVTVPARYSFVCKQEKTGWYILEHHSSEFPA